MWHNKHPHRCPGRPGFHVFVNGALQNQYTFFFFNCSFYFDFFKCLFFKYNFSPCKHTFMQHPL
uniref:Uncharacterized protein n=1 Tax=Anguilla anguilla TaxID=7936 RepID=A0A0E9PTF9_ANGAN